MNKESEKAPMIESQKFMQSIKTRQFLLSTLGGLVPSLLLSIVGTLIIYIMLSRYFPPSSIIPLLVATLFPILGNVVSIVFTRRLDIFGIIVLIGIAVSILGALLGGGQKVLLIRESFVLGAIGLACLVSLVFPKPLGYYSARQLLTANDPKKRSGFEALWQAPSFRQTVWRGTIFWGVLMLGDFLLQVLIVYTLPVVVVLIVSPIAVGGLRLAGLAVTIIVGRRLFQRGIPGITN